MAAQIHEPDAADDDAVAPLTVFISTDAGQRARIAQALDPDGVLIMAPDRESAIRLLTSGEGGEPADDSSVAERASDVIVLGDLVIDRDRACVAWKNQPLELTHLEIEVLACLGQTPGRVWSYERLHRAAWGTDYLGDRDSLHSLIKRLRRKLRSGDVAVDLHAVRGVGFQLMPTRSMSTWELPV